MRLLPAVVANILLVVAAFGVGRLVIRFSPVSFRRVDRLAAVLLAGLGCLGTLLFLVGLIHLSRATILGLVLPAALVGIWFLYRDRKSVFAPVSMARVPLIPAFIIAIIMMITFIGGLAKPVGKITTSDSVAYHYLGPEVWLRDKVIHPVPDESLTSFPAVVETLYAGLLSLGGPRAMELFAFTSLGLLLMVTYGLALRSNLDASGALWATALVAAMPAVYRGCYGGFIDGMLWCFVLLALRFILDAQETRSYLIAGLFSGLAIGTKYHGVVAFALICRMRSGRALERRHKRSVYCQTTCTVRSGGDRGGFPMVLAELDCLGFSDLSPDREFEPLFPGEVHVRSVC